jgi:hypothetical protein
MLIGGTIRTGKPAAPKRGVNFRDDGTAGRDFPSVKGPEMDSIIQISAEETEPGESGVGGFRHRPLNVK